mmetsp:Transcript_17274/g.43522  ORF Transcript_17274/g.43522 Transcript_17274/m.43522 type:complete len:409 (+) Transcript_17274:1537-2763(+)
MREGRGEAPLAGPPSGSWGLCNHRSLLGGPAQAEKLHRVDDVDGIGTVHEHEADGLHQRVVPAHVLADRGEVGEPQPEGAEAVDRQAAGAGLDVEREDDLLEHEHGQHHDRACEDCADLLQQVSDLQVRPAMRQVHESQKYAHACVDVIGHPLHLDLAVGIEVLWALALGSERHHRLDGLAGVHVVDGLLLAVPCGHVEAVAGARPSGIVDVHAHVVAALGLAARGLVPSEGDAKDLLEGLLLVGCEELSGLVEHALRGDGEPDEPCQHVCGRRVCSHRGVHAIPQRQAQEQVAAGEVHKLEAHEPARRRRHVEAQLAGAVDGCQDGETHGSDAMEAILASHRERRQLRDILLVDDGLGDGHVEAGLESCVVHLLVEHVVASVVREQPSTDTSGGRGRGCCYFCCHGD